MDSFLHLRLSLNDPSGWDQDTQGARPSVVVRRTMLPEKSNRHPTEESSGTGSRRISTTTAAESLEILIDRLTDLQTELAATSDVGIDHLWVYLETPK